MLTTALVKQESDESMPMVERAKGVFLYDSDGRDYLDGSSGAMTVSIGHGVPEILSAMADQAAKVCFTYRTQLANEPAEKLAQTITELAPGDLNHAFFVSSGSEATELAMRTAIQYSRARGQTGKTHVLGRKISYHGMTMGALSMSGHDARRSDYGDLLHTFAVGSPPYPFRGLGLDNGDGSFAASEWDMLIRDHGADRVAAIIVEPIVGAAGGALTPAIGYLRALREICDRHDVLLIADEVITGMGRTGSWFACEQDRIVPDMVAMGKGMSAGYTPIAAVLFRDRVINALNDAGKSAPFGHTFSNNPLSSAVGLAVITYIKQNNVLENVAKRAAQIEAGLHALARKYPWMVDVRGRGLMWGFEFVKSASDNTPIDPALKANVRFVAHCFAAGLIVYPAGIAPYNNATLITPPLVISQSETVILLDRLERGVRGFAQEMGLPI